MISALTAVLLGSMFMRAVAASMPRLSASNGTTQTLPINSWTNYRVLFMYAHIDDMEAASGGLAKLLPALGSTAYLVVMTNGDKGCSNAAVCGSATNEELAQIRIEEQYRSGEILGISRENMYFLGYEDGELKNYPREEVSKKLVSLIRSIQPNVVMTWDRTPYFSMIPSEGWGDLGYHPDHQYAGELALDAVFFASEARMWADLGSAWRAQQAYFWVFNPELVPTHCLDITGKAHTAKTEAFLQMKSQYSNATEMRAMMYMLGDQIAQESCHYEKGRVAEAFQYVFW
jgi:LmbE family N-acetylglucosaminyl deacetylase